MAALLDIGEVAVRSGIPPSTLHCDEREQIIESTARKELRRPYRADVLGPLAVVALPPHDRSA